MTSAYSINRRLFFTNVLLSVDSYRQQYIRKKIIYNLLNRLPSAMTQSINNFIIRHNYDNDIHIDMVGNDQQLHLHIF